MGPGFGPLKRMHCMVHIPYWDYDMIWYMARESQVRSMGPEFGPMLVSSMFEWGLKHGPVF